MCSIFGLVMALLCILSNILPIAALPPCLISSRGSDGIGHQMEAKISCLAAAAALNLTYIHIPVDKVDYGANPKEMEEMFGFSRAIPNLSNELAKMYDASTMVLKHREPQPWVGKCSETSWFDNYEETCQSEQHVKHNVWNNDNCWDYFWCHAKQIPHIFWTETVPILRESLLSGIAISDKHAAPAGKGTHAVMHMRLGDAGSRKSKGPWCKSIIQKMVAADGDVRVTVHSDGSEAEVVEILSLSDELKKHVSIYGRDNEDATLGRALYDMMTADILVAAASAFSHSIALLRADAATVSHPNTEERARMVKFGWNMMNVNENGSMQVCVAAPATKMDKTCQKWETVDKLFWSKLMKKAPTTDGFSPSVSLRSVMLVLVIIYAAFKCVKMLQSDDESETEESNDSAEDIDERGIETIPLNPKIKQSIKEMIENRTITTNR